MSEGTHAFIYRVVASNALGRGVRCLKIYRKDWLTPFNLETTAYAYLQRADLEDYIPKVYGWGARTAGAWGLNDLENEVVALDARTSKTGYYGILMEWIEGAEHVSEKNITIGLAVRFAHGLAQIHNAGVLHFDTFDRNMLVVPRMRRAVWIDFSCAQLGEEEHHKGEFYGGAGSAIEYVFR